jgi:hypothetical protein
MERIDYAWGSTDQDLDGQVAQLKSFGYDIVRSEKASGGSREGRVEPVTVIEFPVGLRCGAAV